MSEDSSDWEGKLGESSMGTQYAVGIMLTLLIVAFGLILTKNVLNADWYSGCCNLGSPDMMLLAVWGGILIPLSGIWAAIYDSKQKKKASVVPARNFPTPPALDTPEPRRNIRKRHDDKELSDRARQVLDEMKEEDR